ncbi:MAG TPA: VOC family protein [Candidatus Polarisedimenticolia bacterium]|nr:VOC family protein [Candidatus Polarisedimenticolia bacterium]
MEHLLPRLTKILETVLYFADQDRTERFYVDVLGMRLLSREPGHSLFLRVGSSVFLLFNAESSKRGSLPAHGATGPGHICFLVPPDDYEPWKAHLHSRGVPILREIQWPGGPSFYFHDPDGNVLEIANADIWPA